ncbi:MAG: hypothetical protein WAN92_08195 [Herbaspirillum sp.]
MKIKGVTPACDTAIHKSSLVAVIIVFCFATAGGFVAPNFKAWAEQAFADPHAGMLSLACIAFLGAVMLMLMQRISQLQLQEQPVTRAAPALIIPRSSNDS